MAAQLAQWQPDSIHPCGQALVSSFVDQLAESKRYPALLDSQLFGLQQHHQDGMPSGQTMAHNLVLPILLRLTLHNDEATIS
jgi:hypothetical protein